MLLQLFPAGSSGRINSLNLNILLGVYVLIIPICLPRMASCSCVWITSRETSSSSTEKSKNYVSILHLLLSSAAVSTHVLSLRRVLGCEEAYVKLETLDNNYYIIIWPRRWIDSENNNIIDSELIMKV